MDDNMVLINEDNLYDIADAIRRKNGDTVKYLPEEMASAIDAIPTSEDSNLAGNLAITYDGLTFPVQVGTHCIYDNNYYVCIVAIENAEPFAPAHWTRITAGVEIQALSTELSNKVDKIEGKGLSTNDYTNADKSIVDATGDIITSGQVRTVYKQSNISVNGTLSENLDTFTLCGKCYQTMTPNPYNPVIVSYSGENDVITINNGDGDTLIPCNSGLFGIPVDSQVSDKYAVYTDNDGQKWICDTYDKASRKYVQRVKKLLMQAGAISGSGFIGLMNTSDVVGATALGGTFAYDSLLCDAYAPTKISSINTAPNYSIRLALNGNYIYIKDTDHNSSAEEAAAFINNKNWYVYYPLLNPVTYELTTEQITAIDSLMLTYPNTILSVIDSSAAVIITAIYHTLGI